ncbi:polysaccharide biosynthesis tyrosine autokinase [Acinetobacter qingfengensis]|uniref:Tyrosine protein kinase n=1 Tax=Acinetobacter qingfengensis TaxID=1262585 RepID=A0A1E7RCL7_9GAMM|nr:polysaccharide biosynthesis tyrosine autokinase [Acinetobacter qingfengensis]KAA8732070.1 polysaccharide biosynthesis tyrosine autokinase [Acinetobacter qingfengensis]OEY97150.1 tyrosine protein kinase [Acinetobacter qingfengensis]
MSNSINQNTEDTIDLKELFFSLLAQWKLIILCTLLSMICALLYLRVTPNTYSVDAMVQVETSKGGANAALLGEQLSSIMSDSGLGGMQLAQAEIAILQSRLVLGSTIKELNLDIRISPTDESLWTRLVSPIEFKTNYNSTGVSIHQNQNSFEIRKFNVPQNYLDKSLLLNFNGNTFSLVDQDTNQIVYQGNLNQPASIGAWQISIDAKTTPQQSYLITKNTLPTAVNNILSNFSAAERGKQTGVLGLNYQGTDKAHITKVLNVILATYKQQNVDRSSAEKEQTLNFLQKQLPELKKELDDSERAFNKFREQYNTVDVNQESQLYLQQSIELETQKIQLEQKLAELASQYTEQHPMMQEINAQLGSISKKINELNGTLKRLPEVQRQYLQYYRDVEVKNQLYTNLLNTYQTMNVAKAGEIGNVRIVDTAVEPVKPIQPKKSQVLLLSIFLGGFIGILFALLRNIIRSGVRDSSQIETELDLPVYGAIPRSEYQPSKIKKRKTLPVLAITHSDDMAVESLRSVRTTLLFTLAQAKNNVLMITSSAPNAGKSFISANLAALLAQNGKRILIMDLDLRRGYMHKYFKNNNQQGLSDVLLKQLPVEQVISSTDQENLDLLPRGEHPSNPSELLNSERFAQLMQQLQSQYDYIVLDTPPVLAVTDSMVLSKYSGVNLVIARYGQTPLKELELVKKRFENTGAQINGVILNDIEVQTSGYGYGYSYAYKYNTDKKKS